MKKSLLLTGITTLALVVAFSVVLAAAQTKDASFNGTLCLKGGTPGGLLTSDKKFYALLAPSLALAPYVGQEIRVEGSLVNGSINVSKVEVNQNGNWQEVKLGPTA